MLPDGASAIYGSDAVAGVLNFITRRRFDGAEASGQGGLGGTNTAPPPSTCWPARPGTAARAMLAYGYSFTPLELVNGDRDFYKTDLRTLGGSN